MDKFIYITSEDHLKWCVPSTGVWSMFFTREFLDDLPNPRYEIRTWIEENCQDLVYAWNNCRTPQVGDTAWGPKVVPTGDISLYFSSFEDYTNFNLTWI